jgi:WD40 repeat protein
LKLWDVRSGKLIGETAPVGTDGGWAVFVSAGREIAASVGESKIHILDRKLLNPRIVFSARTEFHYFRRLTASADGRFLAAEGVAEVTVWDVASGKLLWGREFRSGPNSMSAAEFAADGKVIAVAIDGDAEIRLCDPASGRELQRLPKPQPRRMALRELIYAPDGCLFALAGLFESEIRLWNSATRQRCGGFQWQPRTPRDAGLPRRGRPRPIAGVQSVAFSPDGKTLAAAGSDGWLRFFEIATGVQRFQTELHAVKIAFSPNDNYLASLGPTGEIHLWNWRQPRCERLPRLTRVQLERLWADLADEDAARAYQAIAQLLTVPDQVLPLLGERLPAIPHGTIARLQRLVSDLDHDDFDVRQRANKELERAGSLAEGVLRSALAKPASQEMSARIKRLLGGREKVRGPYLRFLRAVEVLEGVGSPAALRELDRLATGDPDALETQDARRARQRLDARERGRP